jgi:hypothetical protein
VAVVVQWSQLIRLRPEHCGLASGPVPPHTRRLAEHDGRPRRVQFVTHPAKVTAGFLAAGSTSNRSSFPFT